MSIETEIRRIVREELMRMASATEPAADPLVEYRKANPGPSFSTRCPTCQLEWKGAMGYCCPNTACPMGAGPVMSTTGVTSTGTGRMR